ncbi:hypothetical protein HYQ46_011912 [Verticillium longisporum]|nr:hypothetical protein HYQ46_011912 [Verticillium longisporum]
MQSLLPLDGNTSSPQRDAHAAQAAHSASPDNSARVHRGGGTPPDATTVANRPRGPRKRDRGEVSRADVAYPRKRATAACRLCRSRKVKCNNARPTCGNCSSHNARFLDLVHTKNPVLEADTLWSYARRVAEDGLKWDSRSCMVLLACALGSVARSFPEGTSMPSPGATSSLKDYSNPNVISSQAFT